MLIKWITFSALTYRCCRWVFLQVRADEAAGTGGVLGPVIFRFSEARGETATSRIDGGIADAGDAGNASCGKNLGCSLCGGWSNENILALPRPFALKIFKALDSATLTY